MHADHFDVKVSMHLYTMLDWIGPGCSHCSHMVALRDRICIIPTDKTCAFICLAYQKMD